MYFFLFNYGERPGCTRYTLIESSISGLLNYGERAGCTRYTLIESSGSGLLNYGERAGLESIKKSSTLESYTLAISTLYLEGEWRDHSCAVNDAPYRVGCTRYTLIESSGSGLLYYGERAGFTQYTLI